MQRRIGRFGVREFGQTAVLSFRSVTKRYGRNRPRVARAVKLICTADPAVREIIVLTLRVTGLALLVSTLTGVPAGCLGLWSRLASGA